MTLPHTTAADRQASIASAGAEVRPLDPIGAEVRGIDLSDQAGFAPRGSGRS